MDDEWIVVRYVIRDVLQYVVTYWYLIMACDVQKSENITL